MKKKITIVILAVITASFISAQQARFQAFKTGAAQRFGSATAAAGRGLQATRETLARGGAAAAAQAGHIKESFSNLPKLKSCLSAGTCTPEEMKQLATVLKVSAVGVGVAALSGAGYGVYRKRGAIAARATKVREALRPQALMASLNVRSKQLAAKILPVLKEDQQISDDTWYGIIDSISQLGPRMTDSERAQFYSFLNKIYEYAYYLTENMGALLGHFKQVAGIEIGTEGEVLPEPVSFSEIKTG